MYQTFETDRLLLQPTTEVDAAFLFELLNTPKWLKNIGDRNVHSIDEAKAYIKNRMTPQLEKLGFSNYTIIRKSDGTKIGICGLYDRDGLEGIDIGFALLPNYEKQGYAFEAASELLKAAVNVFKISNISAITIKDNPDSQKLIEKIGLKFHSFTTIPNDDEELLLYRL